MQILQRKIGYALKHEQYRGDGDAHDLVHEARTVCCGIDVDDRDDKESRDCENILCDLVCAPADETVPRQDVCHAGNYKCGEHEERQEKYHPPVAGSVDHRHADADEKKKENIADYYQADQPA